SVIRSCFGEVGYTPASRWDEEFESMLAACGDDAEPDTAYDDWECEEIELICSFGEIAIYRRDRRNVYEFNIFRLHGNYLDTDEFNWSSNLRDLELTEEQQGILVNLLKSALKKSLQRYSQKSFSANARYIQESLLADDNDPDWILDNSAYFLGHPGWAYDDAAAKSVADQLKILDDA
ncbi:MAG: hypothetical protein ACRC62_20465, partial [Microcoleus sp.]